MSNENVEIIRRQIAAVGEEIARTDEPFQMLAVTLGADPFIGRILTGRVEAGTARAGDTLKALSRDGERIEQFRISKILAFRGLTQTPIDEAQAGDIIAFSGVEGVGISETLCDPAAVEQLPVLSVDEPTISMTFQVNDSPFAGVKDRSGGKFLTSRQLRDRLTRETQHNVALKVEDTADADKFKVSGRGELHLSILIENMRREGYELAVSRPEVIIREIDGVVSEPFESLVVDLEEQFQGGVMGRLGERKAILQNMEPDGKGRVRLDFIIPARGLIGFQTEFRTLTAGTGLLFHVFDHYGPKQDGAIGQRINGVLISNGTGPSPAYAQIAMQERGRLFIEPGEEIYEGQIVGIHAKDNDLTVNALRGKQLTNFRASGTDKDEGLIPPVKLSLEQALEFIDDDELVEVTPKQIRLRKKYRTENDRKKSQRGG